MAYQNNNNRVVPNAIEDRDLKPAATPTDKMIRYSPQYGQTGGYNNTAKALADIGKGLMDMETLIQIQAQDNALRAVAETEAAGGNKKEWRDVSKKIKGFAKFNPYNDNAYRRLQSQDIMNQAYLELVTTPDLDKKAPEVVNTLFQDKTKQMIEAFKETGLSPKDYGASLVMWDDFVKDLRQKQTIKNADFRFKQTQTKLASSASFKMLNVLETLPDDITKGQAIQSVIKEADEEMQELGWEADTRIGVHFATLQGLLAKDADSLTMADINEAYGNITIDGRPAEEVIPNYHAQLRQLYKEAKRAIYDDKVMAFQDHQLDLKISAQEASKEMYQWVQENPNATNAETNAQIKSMIEKYDLQENGFDFFNQIARDQRQLEEFQSVKSDPIVLQELGAKAALGTLTGDDINRAILNGELNWREGLQFTDRINREAKADLQAVKQSYTDLSSKLNKSGVYGSVLGEKSKDIQDIKAQANQLALDLKEGKITPDEAQRGIQDLERISQAKARMKQTKATNDSFLLNANYIKSQQAPAYKEETAIKAFKALGLERGAVGQKIQPQVTSRPNDNRVINNKKAPHKGYDLAATKDTKVHSVNMRGTCVYAGFSSDFGNYVVIKYDNGTYMRAGHFSTSTKHLAGKIIPAGMYIGNAGNTGHSTGTHLHVDFWNKNREIISVEQFQRLMR